MNRKQFLSIAGISSLGIAFPTPIFSSNGSVKNKISLAQWSMNRSFFSEKKDAMDFPIHAASMGFAGVEYVNQFYFDQLKNGTTSSENVKSLAKILNGRANDNNISNVLIMVDEEGKLADSSSAVIKTAIEQHKKWVELAAEIGCHSIRVNLSGEKDPNVWIEKSVEGLTGLCEFAKTMKINVIVENHGGLSSNAGLLAQVMKQTNLDNCGTLPDFGNFCISSGWGNDSGCKEWYDMYKGVSELMPYAKSVSAKSYDFDANGNETKIDYVKMMGIVKEYNYDGFIGVEYEGGRLGEKEGILATKNLIERFL
ncbi:MAG: TIM barrel protein [Flavobacteriaceae bacterium]|nr:TIM barrel protein [Flavobacteriaceae bacterium]MDG1966458.1 TIM barrel protein [Flavobacteriaceae bacterium]